GVDGSPDTTAVQEYRRLAAELFRTIGLQQAARVMRGSAAYTSDAAAVCPRTLALYTVLEAQAADERLVAELPGMAKAVNRLRQWMLERRPAVESLPPACRPVETVV